MYSDGFFVPSQTYLNALVLYVDRIGRERAANNQWIRDLSSRIHSNAYDIYRYHLHSPNWQAHFEEYKRADKWVHRAAINKMLDDNIIVPDRLYLKWWLYLSGRRKGSHLSSKADLNSYHLR